jgi:hypothetical protein
MNFRKTVPLVIFSFIAIILLIVIILKSSLLTMLAILVPLGVLGAIAIIIATALGEGKKIYQLAGAVIAWVVFFFVWLLWSPLTFDFVTHTGVFWALQVFLVINLVLLGKTGMMVVLAQAITILMISILIVGLIANFTRGGPELMADIKSYITSTSLQAYITKIETLDKERRAELLQRSLKQIEREVKEGVSINRVSSKLEQIKRESKKIYPFSEPKKILSEKKLPPPRRLSGVFDLKPEEMYDTGIKIRPDDFRKGPILYLRQKEPKVFWIVNAVGKDIKVNRRTYSVKIIPPAGEIQLRGGTEPTRVWGKVVL